MAPPKAGRGGRPSDKYRAPKPRSGFSQPPHKTELARREAAVTPGGWAQEGIDAPRAQVNIARGLAEVRDAQKKYRA